MTASILFGDHGKFHDLSGRENSALSQNLDQAGEDIERDFGNQLARLFAHSSFPNPKRWLASCAWFPSGPSLCWVPEPRLLMPAPWRHLAQLFFL